jgi:hypothetical protein
MKIILSFCLLLAPLLVRGQAQKVDPNFEVYLLVGQSNMAGRGAVDAESKQVNPRILMMDSTNQWVPATDPVHFDKPKSAGVGPGRSFAQEMLGVDGNKKIGLIPCALGGSPLKVWTPKAIYLKVFHPYDDALARAQEAMKQGTLKGILWHQGESDNDSIHAALYVRKLSALIARFRTDLQQPDLPFVAGEIGYFNKADYLNKVIQQLPQQVPGTAVVSAAGLTDKGDKLHFDTASARELGKRYAEAMKSLQKPASKTKSKRNRT